MFAFTIVLLDRPGIRGCVDDAGLDKPENIAPYAPEVDQPALAAMRQHRANPARAGPRV